MDTLKLYKEDVYRKCCETQLTACRVEEDGLLLEFAETVFFPEGGGQPSDIGTATIAGESFRIDAAREDGNAVIHICAYSGAALPVVGASAFLEINWEHRFDNMQRHCGEHILSGIFYKKFGGVNRGFHMGSDHITLDINFEGEQTYTELTDEMIEELELAANEVIWQDIPVTASFFTDRETAVGLPLRKELTVDHDISVIAIGEGERLTDCVACCGTHPSSTGQIGLLKIYKVEKNKGMFRVYFEAGRRAFLDYRKKHDIVTALGNKFSTGADDLIAQMDIEESKSREIKSELNKIKHNIIKKYAEEIAAALADPQQTGGGIFIREYDNLSINEVLNIGRFLRNPIPKLIALIATQENAVALFSDGKYCDCNKLIKENAPIYNGKGGGRADNARALFTSREYVDTFLDLLEKHLR